jgi:membrane-bound lytic murein transglycosylase B
MAGWRRIGMRRQRLAALLLAVLVACMAFPPFSVAFAEDGWPGAGPPLADPNFTNADLEDFNRFVQALWPKAQATGISPATFKRAFDRLQPDPHILTKPKQQPELERPIWDYLKQIVSDKRYNLGREALRINGPALSAIEKTYGVPRNVVAAVWGVESMYGTNTGSYNVVRSLATLAWRGGRKARFGEQQLLSALRILEHGDVAPEAMTGSWAGAMGHVQFIPTTYEAYAVDFDHDNKRDIWGDATDAVASAANFLKKSGWRAGEPWGYEVRLPRDFDYSQAGLPTRHPLSFWSKSGVVRPGGEPLGQADLKASLLLPAGSSGPALLVFGNFRALLRYNNSVSYGLAVAWLSQKLADGPFVTAPWPVDEPVLQLDEKREMQRLLVSRGFTIKAADGVMGAETIGALRAYQKSKGLPADGYPSARVLMELRTDAHS